MVNARVLVVEADRVAGAQVCDGLRALGHMVVPVSRPEEARELLGQSEFDVVLSDRRLGLDPDVEAILLPENPGLDEVAALVAKAAELVRLRRENALLRARLERQAPPRILTDDRVMAEVVATAGRLAASDVPVLIQGEAGTGKRLLARHLHHAGPRAAFPFQVVEGHAAEVELFGGGGRPGALQMARKGFVLVREVGAVPPSAQAALLRALEAREFVPPDGSRPVPVETRLAASTRRDLKADVQAGRFREDLFYLLSGATLKVPALRERKADIPLLAAHVLHRLGLRKTVSPSALGALVAYGWPGNVRELEIVVERAALLTAGDTIPPEHLALGPPPQNPRTDLSLEDMEREYIRVVLRENRGHRGRAARALGIDPKTLYNKLGPGRIRKRS